MQGTVFFPQFDFQIENEEHHKSNLTLTSIKTCSNPSDVCSTPTQHQMRVKTITSRICIQPSILIPMTKESDKQNSMSTPIQIIRPQVVQLLIQATYINSKYLSFDHEPKIHSHMRIQFELNFHQSKSQGAIRITSTRYHTNTISTTSNACSTLKHEIHSTTHLHSKCENRLPISTTPFKSNFDFNQPIRFKRHLPVPIFPSKL